MNRVMCVLDHVEHRKWRSSDIVDLSMAQDTKV